MSNKMCFRASEGEPKKSEESYKPYVFPEERKIYFRHQPHPVYILQAAIRDIDRGIVYTLPRPARHGDIIRHMVENYFIDKIRDAEYIQGFITEEGVFVNRWTAKKIATKAGQLLEREAGKDELYSEDVW